ncbi:hypothetical protein ABW19_dt0204427 [Dactylella cylindrospora]|nr:hypothetical protein ABW19_dt0204427 [Dactylella cylindrospora]
MAMTESPAQQHQHLHEALSVAGSSSTPPTRIDEVRKGSFQKSEGSTASSVSLNAGNNGPTPPSSPPQGVSVEPLVVLQSSASQDQADISSPPVMTTPPIQQQPTPPSTLPEDIAAFPQASSGHRDEGEAESGRVTPSLASSTIHEPYVSENNQQISSHRDDRSVSPVSPQSSVSSELNDGVPTLDANEAAFILEADAAEDDEPISLPQSTSSQIMGQTPSSSRSQEQLPPVPNQMNDVPQNASASSRHSSHSDFRELPQPPYQQQQQPVISHPLAADSSQYPYRYSSLLASEGASSAGAHHTRRRRSRDGSSASRSERRQHLSPDIAVPPWQPDSEVNSCPICGNGFSFFYRKHHCRKCGRVVCAPCSPHRIVIPKSFVVYPPNTIDPDLALLGITDPVNNRRHSYMGGDTGVEVRICNNCLAGENTGSSMGSNERRQSIPSPAGGAGRFWQDPLPPNMGNPNNDFSQQPVDFASSTSSNRRRAVSTANHLTQAGYHTHGRGYPAGGYPGSSYTYGQAHSFGSQNAPHNFPPFHHGQHPPYHVHPVQQQAPPLQHPTPSYPLPQPAQHNFSFAPAQFYPSPQPQQYQHHHNQYSGHQRSASSSHPYSQYSPVNQPIRGHLDTSQQPIPAFSMPDITRPRIPIADQYMAAGSREAQTHSAPPQPRLKETDYCPICQQVLPPPNPITNDESAREAHIQECIENAVGSHDTPRRRSNAGTPTNYAATPPNIAALSQAQVQAQVQTQASSHVERPRRNTGANRMVIYTATEKDTYALGNDARADDQKAECVICFEEFEAGDVIARLECFCRYHKKCIQDWFGRKENATCPIHAMNE